MSPKSETEPSSLEENSEVSRRHQSEKDNFAKDEFVEEATPVQQQTSTLAGVTEIEELSQEHRDYLLARHGTLELDPVPDMHSADPYNWSSWKKTINLLLVAFHAAISTLTAAAIIPAFGDIAEDLGVSLHQATYLTSLQIAILGVGPLVWKPVARRFGCRPIFLVSTLCSFAGNIGCAKSPNYSSMAVCRAIAAFSICPAAALGSEVVAKTFFKKERARYMGIWTVMITVGVPLGPLIFGFVAYRVGYRWIYWVLAIVNAAQFVLYLFFGPETVYVRGSVSHSHSSFRAEYLTFRRIDPRAFTAWEFVEPLTMVRHASVIIPAAAYAMIFVFGSVLVTVEIPELFQEKFGFTPEQLGLQFIGVVVGSLLGEQLGGSMSDYWMTLRARRIRKSPPPEFRLWLNYIGYLLTIAGAVVFLVRTEQAPHGHWNITAIIGVAIAAFGNQVVTTVSITYSVDCHHTEAASVGVCITFVRQIWGFIGPFWFPAMFKSVGVGASSGVVSALVVGVCIIPTAFLHWNRQKRVEV